MTVGGFYTIAELRDLVAAKDAAMADLGTAWTANQTAFRKADPTGAQVWAEQYAALQTRYTIARGVALADIAWADLSMVNDALNPNGDPAYRNLLTAIQMVPGVVSTGDLQDLWNRLDAVQRARGAGPIVVTSNPQPANGGDADLNLYNAIGKLQKQAKDDLPWIIGGAVALGSFLLLSRSGGTTHVTVTDSRTHVKGS